MRHSLHKKKPRMRVDRNQQIVAEQLAVEESSGWAVSYSDLLMVLMSFFVIFYSQGSDTTEGIIKELSLAMGTKLTGTEGAGSGAGAGAGAGETGDAGSGSGVGMEAGSSSGAGAGADQGGPREGMGKGKEKEGHEDVNYDKIYANLFGANLDVQLEADKQSVSIHLPDNMYNRRSFQLSADAKRLIGLVSQVLQPFQDRLDFYFVGHSDASPLAAKDRFLTDNFALSSLRATNALQYAMALGMPKDHLYAQGGAENERNSRSLSIRVKIRQEEQTGH